eukprot:tig00000455_g1034.t1
MATSTPVESRAGSVDVSTGATYFTLTTARDLELLNARNAAEEKEKAQQTRRSSRSAARSADLGGHGEIPEIPEVVARWDAVHGHPWPDSHDPDVDHDIDRGRDRDQSKEIDNGTGTNSTDSTALALPPAPSTATTSSPPEATAHVPTIEALAPPVPVPVPLPRSNSNRSAPLQSILRRRLPPTLHLPNGMRSDSDAEVQLQPAPASGKSEAVQDDEMDTQREDDGDESHQRLARKAGLIFRRMIARYMLAFGVLGVIGFTGYVVSCALVSRTSQKLRETHSQLKYGTAYTTCALP